MIHTVKINQRISKWMNHPNVQIIGFLSGISVYCFTIQIYAAIMPNFIQQKVCSSDVQPDLNATCNNTNAINEATDIVTIRGIIREAVPVVILLLAGSWRDATGQYKPLIYSSLIGGILGVSVLLLAALKWSMSVWTASIIESVLNGIFGGNKVMYLGATCAMTDLTTEDQRSNRLMMFQVSVSVAIFTANAVSGYCLHLLGYMWFFIMVIALFFVAFVLVVFLKDGEKRLDRNEQAKLFQKMKSITKSRPNNLVVWLMLIGCVMINVCSLAENNLYLYYLQLGFDFTVKESGLYTAFRLMFSVVGTAILSPVFTNVLKWSDFRIGIISSFMCFIAAVLMIFAKTVVHLIIFGMLDFLRLFASTLPLSIVTKYVRGDEVGIFVSLRFIGECLFPIFLFYIYEIIFSATSSTIPGGFFMASAAIILLVFVFYWICSCIYIEAVEPLDKDSSINNDVEKREAVKTPGNDTIIEKY
ncbi:unnamed protein product [Nezara viridula]|uniref:Uncharacterized protein n=1 Tax=Nezara viridula TaxID=85310 RepID=A0A9P0MTU5_NEZVI|nr:unnamed protein product [Nezara viridula]